MEKQSHFARVRSWYQKYERPISSLSLIGGFVFDALTLKRVDMFWENFWVGAHLLIVAICIVLINRAEKDEVDTTNPARFHFWLVNILQFFFGGLFSTYLVFYFRSGTFAASWPFFIILALAFIANERLKHHYSRLAFQISILYLSIYLFTIYIIPVVFHGIGAWIFILSGAISLVVIGLFLRILHYTAKESFLKKGGVWVLFWIAVIFAGMNVLYFYNLIPPIPLSLKDAGLYPAFTVNAPGNYTVGYEDQGIFGFLKPSETIQLTSGAPLYAYSAIFSPASFNLKIVHKWQYYDAGSKSWKTRGKISLSVIGGSDGGYRTFSMEENLTAGAWRVNIETQQGQIIGRLNFTVVIVTSTPALQSTEID
jgi:hypothetical protein